LLAGEAVNPALGLVLVAVVMAIGGLLNARRVADTMSRKNNPPAARNHPARAFRVAAALRRLRGASG